MTSSAIHSLYVLPRGDFSEWLTRIGVPVSVSWRIGRYTGSDPDQP